MGIGRSGAIWGGWFAGNLGSLPIYVIDNIYEINDRFSVSFPDSNGIFETMNKTSNNKTYFIIMGASSSDNTFENFEKMNIEYLKKYNYKFAVLYLNSSSKFKIDFIGKTISSPDYLPWHERKEYKPYLNNIYGSK